MKLYGKSIPLPDEYVGICDFALDVVHEGEIRILQITDTQIIDATQRRTPDRLQADEIEVWDPANMDLLCFNQIRSLVAQARPDLILITGDIVYGEFDDSGVVWERYLAFMESLGIPWAPVFGNHDNETHRGTDWQCALLEACPRCLFARGTVSGNGNYTIAVSQNGRLLRLIHMLDSGGCERASGIAADQTQLIDARVTRAREMGSSIPSFLACHIPPRVLRRKKAELGYPEPPFSVGVDCPADHEDFGAFYEKSSTAPIPPNFWDFLKSVGIDGLFFGHDHANTLSFSCEGIRFTYGLKTGQYDYYVPGMLGGTLITLSDTRFTVVHLPTLTALGKTVTHSRFW